VCATVRVRCKHSSARPDVGWIVIGGLVVVQMAADKLSLRGSRCCYRQAWTRRGGVKSATLFEAGFVA
jgi:hypothetical protein